MRQSPDKPAGRAPRTASSAASVEAISAASPFARLSSSASSRQAPLGVGTRELQRLGAQSSAVTYGTPASMRLAESDQRGGQCRVVFRGPRQSHGRAQVQQCRIESAEDPQRGAKIGAQAELRVNVPPLARRAGLARPGGTPQPWRPRLAAPGAGAHRRQTAPRGPVRLEAPAGSALARVEVAECYAPDAAIDWVYSVRICSPPPACQSLTSWS
jgi:hypothetical protein